MNNKKGIRRLLQVFCLIFAAQAMQISSIDFSDQTADGDLLFDFEAGFLEDVAEHPRQTTDLISDAALIQLLAGSDKGFSYVTALATDLYLHTNPLRNRPLATLPSLLSRMPHSWADGWHLSAHGFFNQTGKMFFTKHSPYIDSYVSLDHKSPLQQLNISEFSDISISSVIGLFKKVKIQERRGGLLMRAAKKCKNWSLECSTPLYYLEHNYILTEREILDIQQSDVFARDNSGAHCDRDSAEKIVRKFVVSDSCGIGDTQIRLRHHAINKKNLKTTVGLQATLPTAWSFGRGLIGSHFTKRLCRPTIDLKHIVSLAISQPDDPTPRAIALDFMVAASDWLSAMALETSLGNNHHAGFGLFLESLWNIERRVYLETQASVEYLLPATEIRPFIKQKNPDDFNRQTFLSHSDGYSDSAPDSEEQKKFAALLRKDVAFLNRQSVDLFFPPRLHAKVVPGFIAQITIEPHFVVKKCFTQECCSTWDCGIGYDLWYQHHERIKRITGNGLPVKISQALRSRAYQGTVFGTIDYQRTRPKTAWSCGLRGEAVATTSGIGRFFTVEAHFAIEF